MKATTPKGLRTAVAEVFSLKEDNAPNEEIRDRLRSAGKVTGTNLCMMVCANLIACIGLSIGSVTVLIGAMLIEPLMGSILMLAYSTVSADKRLFKAHSLGFLSQILASVLASSLYFLIIPLKEPSREILELTHPGLFEIVVAFVGGVAGVIGHTRREKVNTIIPGVAIATSLMPPLCVCGYGVANGDLRILGGAAYLFLANAYFIALGAGLVLSLFRIPRVEEMTEAEWKRAGRRMIRNTLLLLIPALIAAVLKALC